MKESYDVVWLTQEMLDNVAERKKLEIDILNKLGVIVIQGYYFDKPLSKEDMTARLKDPYYKSK